ncbi:D-alanyl-D-alanine carboxypeptidase/D-alanyl-D-alanine-endopeptidase [Streptomyces davaonensis JCM 4913]|uniref:D-alanyl-D-alanine carboxypeptidase/D-alanyl-D-alanine-endopeptidase n=1 Tax=Streptomyces davaonensis (strain DSM 101723 / JCM 4913 / KCC S-0913 / 768) TaxID=1214101 RepID=K4QWJ4_STRDJ|nr:D-alanyl-D-alanine carboxypeptidase/D-alanyl-D-alanine-endopeptidase [Streptomyces davaonensis]CCK28441.1 D-alanyl-D-alanine carboxypeptidase/D-alanyl-D-alanine-endopeptidase [Streptomyces davaonensis JCM 4913]
MVVPELRPWRAARPRLARIAGAVRPRLARAATAGRPRLARLGRTVSAQVTRPKTWQYTAGAATAGLALAVGVVTAAGPWDSSGQRKAERDRAVAQEGTGGADHGRSSGTAAKAPGPAPSAASVLTGLGGATGRVKSAPGTKALSTLLDPLLGVPALGARHSAAVVDVTTGKRLYGAGSGTALTPASTTKIATAAAALNALGPDHRLTTRTALEPDTKELVLVGGGDPTLTARKDTEGLASLRTLAEDTAAALKKDGVREVTLSYDTTLYAGEELHPIGVNDNLARVSALMADEARTDDSTSGPVPRVAEPAAEAARTFADLIEDHGITTTSPGPSKATARAETLAEVSSPPLAALVERMLTNSDNDIAEALARHTALATGERPDLTGAGRAIRAELGKLGLPVKGTEFKDGSGLNRDNRLTADLLTALLAQSGDPAHPELRPILTGLPVAGFTGTLTSRYADGAAGVVRAKTGTLTGVNALAGTVVDQDGHLLAFAFLATDTTNAAEAQSALDKAATALAGCGCG